MGIFLAITFIIGFILFLVFVPADKIVKNFSSDTNRCHCRKNEDWHNDGGLKWMEESRRDQLTNPAYRHD